MAAGESPTTIANQALIALGAAPISTLDDNVKGAILCKTLYENARQQALQERPWRWARAETQLAADPTAPLVGYDAQYSLPADFVRMIGIPDDPDEPWEVFGTFLRTDSGNPVIHYVQDVSDCTRFPPLFSNVVAAALAASIGLALTGDRAKVAQAQKDYEDMLHKAAMADGQQATPREIDGDIWLRARP